jgi:hypothetical protein
MKDESNQVFFHPSSFIPHPSEETIQCPQQKLSFGPCSVGGSAQ